ncbi:hypothetical protein [Streptomyces sp. CB03911]|uniref:hypothetical protein n=1 Tax=Streptomyces sp. CB03911 TaxID=1804758 RepID=UPI0018FEC481|nr:hypothetical protein [Streptomyces sp. CB03911]
MTSTLALLGGKPTVTATGPHLTWPPILRRAHGGPERRGGGVLDRVAHTLSGRARLALDLGRPAVGGECGVDLERACGCW